MVPYLAYQKNEEERKNNYHKYTHGIALIIHHKNGIWNKNYKLKAANYLLFLKYLPEYLYREIYPGGFL